MPKMRPRSITPLLDRLSEIELGGPGTRPLPRPPEASRGRDGEGDGSGTQRLDQVQRIQLRNSWGIDLMPTAVTQFASVPGTSSANSIDRRKRRCN